MKLCGHTKTSTFYQHIKNDKIKISLNISSKQYYSFLGSYVFRIFSPMVPNQSCSLVYLGLGLHCLPSKLFKVKLRLSVKSAFLHKPVTSYNFTENRNLIESNFFCKKYCKSYIVIAVVSSLWLMMSHKKVCTHKQASLFPGAHLCNGILAVSNDLYIR